MKISGLQLSSTIRSTSKIMANPPAAYNSIMTRSPLKLWGATNFRYEDSPHPMTSLRIPGFSHESYDRDWNPKITSIMQTSSTSRIYALHKQLPSSADKEEQRAEEKYFLDWPRLTQEFYTFASSSEFVISRALYDRNVPKWPIDMNFTLGNIGNCSVAFTSDFYACDDEKECFKKLLWSNTSQVVTVNKTTRKAARLPEWFLSKYKGKGCMSKGLVVKPFDRPAVTYAHSAVVQWTDTDNYRHTNWTSYARWAIDALHAALLLRGTDSPGSYSPYSHGAPSGDSPSVRAGSALKGITQDTVAQGLCKMQIVYLRECLQGEHVETHVWQHDDEEKELVYFSVVKNGEDICQMKMWFFRSSSDGEDIPQ